MNLWPIPCASFGDRDRGETALDSCQSALRRGVRAMSSAHDAPDAKSPPTIAPRGYFVNIEAGPEYRRSLGLAVRSGTKALSHEVLSLRRFGL